MKNSVVVDYGVGNIASISNFLTQFGINVEYTNDSQKIVDADLVVLPGVGSFGPAKKQLDRSGATSGILERSRLDLPILGICLGFQLLTMGSEESHDQVGLGLINAYTRKLANGPRIGWQEISRSGKIQTNTPSYYFNHSYAVTGSPDVEDFSYVDRENYYAMLRNRSIVGVQYHPEKSQRAGIDFFASLLSEFWRQ